MKMLSCRHRLIPEEESFCWLEASSSTEDGRDLVFHDRDGRPVRCAAALAAACPFRESAEAQGRAQLVPCPHCHGRHRNGSSTQQLCEAWSLTKAELALVRKRLPEGHRYYDHGTMVPPYPEDTTPMIRRLVWQRLQPAVVRRDRYTCQDCGASFGARRRKVYDPQLRRGRGGYRWESLEVHHIIARSRGGSDHPGNLKTLCPSCHARYTVEQAGARTTERREARSTLRTLEESGYGDDGMNDPWD